MAKSRQPKRTDALALARKIQQVRDLWDSVAAEADGAELTLRGGGSWSAGFVRTTQIQRQRPRGTRSAAGCEQGVELRA